MLALHLEQGNVRVIRIPRPRRPEGHALIRLLYAGICSTDLELQRGYYGFTGIPGHEFVGEVIEAGNRELIGKRVAGEINLACGTCEWCSRKLGRHCPTRSVLGIVDHPGSFREILTLPEANLHLVPERVSSESAVFIEPLAAACEILDQVKIPRGREVAVLGDGKLGLLVAQVLACHGANVHQFGRHKQKLRIAERAGVTGEVRKGRMPVAAYDYVVDATGSADGLRIAASMTRPRGTLILKSTVHGLVPVDTAPLIVNELTLVGSRCGRFPPAIKLLQTGRINLDGMVSDTMRLEDGPRAFARAAERGVLKVLLQG